MVRLRGLPTDTARREHATAHAAFHRRGRNGREARSGGPAHRYRQVAVLPDSGTVPLPQYRCPDRGHIAPGGADGGSGGGAGGSRHRRLRRHQRSAVTARAGERPRPGEARGRGHSHHLAGAAPQPVATPGARPARDRCLGAGRGTLPFQVGARLPSGLSLRGTLHPREGGGGTDSARVVPDRDREARRDGGHRVPFPGRARCRADDLRRRCPAHQPRLPGGADHRRGEVRPPPPDSDGGPAAGGSRRRHRLLRHAPADRRGGGVPAGEGRIGRPLPCRAAARDPEERAAAIHRRGAAGHCRHQRLRHGDRQAGRPARRPRRHPGVAGELSPGSRSCRA